jgi:nitroreductase
MEKFNVLREIVTERRSIKPAVFNGKKIEDHQIRQLLQLANWAPTHGFTEPWRFIVYSGEAVRQFCYRHAGLYRQGTVSEKFNAGKYEKQKHNGDKVSHVIIVYMQRGDNSDITELEEVCATAAAAQNILLGAEALGIAALWSTGGMVMHPLMRTWLGLREEDIIVGLLYLGYTGEPVKPGRRVTVETKTTWIDQLDEPAQSLDEPA